MFTKSVALLLFCGVTLISASSIYAEDNVTETREPVMVLVDHRPPVMQPKTTGQAKWDWFHPKLDHYNNQDKTTWAMRYTYNFEFAKPNGPIFIYLGGEWEIDVISIEYGQIWDMARENGGSLFFTEHRFYGKSMPKPDLSINSLNYLNSLQAIQDNIEFIQYLKSQPQYANSKVVVMGCSYSAAMAVWARELFPNDVFAAYASSGPIVAVDNFSEFFEIVGTVIKERDVKCWNAIKNGVKEAEKIYYSDGGFTARKMFKSCYTSSQNIRLDPAVFFKLIANSFAGLIQFAKVGTVEAACHDLMSRPGKNDAERLASYVTRNLSDKQCHMASYSSYVDYYGRLDTPRQWMYQVCNEFGFFQTSKSQGNQPFGNSFSETTYNHELCRDAYSFRFTDEYIKKAHDTTNKNYGGLSPNVSRVLSVHGAKDPWLPISLRKSTANAPVYVVDGGSHCEDITSVSSRDSEALKNAKNNVRKQIREWLQSSN